MSVSRNQIIRASTLNAAFESQVIDTINSAYPVVFGPSSRPFNDLLTGFPDWERIFQRGAFVSADPRRLTPFGAGDAWIQQYNVSEQRTITAQGIKDAYVGHASLELTRYRMFLVRRRVSATGTTAPAPETITGLAGRMNTQNRAPGFSNPSGTSSFFRGGRITASTLVNWLDNIATEWDRVAVINSSNYGVDYTVCHASCHNQCHGSRGRR